MNTNTCPEHAPLLVKLERVLDDTTTIRVALLGDLNGTVGALETQREHGQRITVLEDTSAAVKRSVWDIVKAIVPVIFTAMITACAVTVGIGAWLKANGIL